MTSLVWTRSDSILSRVIRWVTKEDVSHFAWVFDDKIVFHSNLIGIHLTWYEWFEKDNTIVHKIDIPLTLREEENLYQILINTFPSRRYDYGALLFFGISGIMHRFFGVPMPKKNLWGDPKAWLCDELFEPFKNKVHLSKDLDMISPGELYKAINDVMMNERGGLDEFISNN